MYFQKLSLALLAACSVQSTSAASIFAIGEGSADHTTLVAAVEAAGLKDILSGAGDGRLTLLAPTNAAFDALPEGTLTKYLDPVWKSHLVDILGYHVIGNVVKAADISEGFVVTTFNDEDLTMTLGPPVMVMGEGSEAGYGETDIEADNGVVHVIDTVLLPTSVIASIADMAAGNPDFSTLATALEAGGLVDTLSGDGPFTVFAPTNDAFAELGGDVTDLLKPENLDKLVDILKYHVVSGNVVSNMLTDGDVPTINGDTVKVDLSDGVKINDASVVTADILANNGVIHVIDKVLMPPADDAGMDETVSPVEPTSVTSTIVDIAAGNSDFATLVAALGAAGLVDTLAGAGPFTVFAPNNAAFAKLGVGTVADLLKPGMKDKLVDILKYHVVSGNFTSDKLADGDVKTLNGETVEVELHNGVMINDANVVTADILADNGVIHVIDKVLMPPVDDAADTDKPVPVVEDPATSADVADTSADDADDTSGSFAYGTVVAALAVAVGTVVV